MVEKLINSLFVDLHTVAQLLQLVNKNAVISKGTFLLSVLKLVHVRNTLLKKNFSTISALKDKITRLLSV